MLPFELSLNIVLMAATAIIIISYAILLVKLKLSIKNEEPASPTDPQISVKPQKSPREPATKVESKEGVQIKAHAETAETKEKQKQKKDEETKKSFFLFGERNFEGCTHRFGYLGSLPKNTPIPDECFGCPQIVECLRTLNK